MQIQPDEVRAWSGVAAIFVAIGGFIYKIRQHGKDIEANRKAVAAIPEDIKRRLYDSESMPIYVSAATCQRCQKECRDRFDARMSSMDQKLDRIIEYHMKKD